jgi:hypothetical protein
LLIIAQRRGSATGLAQTGGVTGSSVPLTLAPQGTVVVVVIVHVATVLRGAIFRVFKKSEIGSRPEAQRRNMEHLISGQFRSEGVSSRVPSLKVLFTSTTMARRAGGGGSTRTHRFEGVAQHARVGVQPDPHHRRLPRLRCR